MSKFFLLFISGFINYFHLVLLITSYKPISSVHPYYTRQSNDNLFLNQVRTTQYRLRSFRFSGVKLWNSLPLDIKQITPFSRFRENVKNSVVVHM